MALIHVNFYSDALKISTAMYVILPEKKLASAGREEKAEAKFPTLYLLHGLSDDYTMWVRRTSIERYAAEKNLAVVMPAVNRSFYCDMAHGAKYWTFISEELPAVARSFFPLSPERRDNFVAGLSMGGYGALKLGLRFPERFAAAAGLSSVTDIQDDVYRHNGSFFEDIFEDAWNLEGTKDDLGFLARETAAGGAEKPEIFLACGTEDDLLGENRRFRDLLKELGYSVRYEEGPGGHEWKFWDEKIQTVLDWLPFQREPE